MKETISAAALASFVRVHNRLPPPATDIQMRWQFAVSGFPPSALGPMREAEDRTRSWTIAGGGEIIVAHGRMRIAP